MNSLMCCLKKDFPFIFMFLFKCKVRTLIFKVKQMSATSVQLPFIEQHVLSFPFVLGHKHVSQLVVSVF